MRKARGVFIRNLPVGGGEAVMLKISAAASEDSGTLLVVVNS